MPNIGMAGVGAGGSSAPNLEAVTVNVVPDVDNTYALGSATKSWSDIYLGDGGIINWNNGDVTITHSLNALSVQGGAVTFGETLTVSKVTYATLGIYVTNTDNTDTTDVGEFQATGGTVIGVLRAVATDKLYIGATSNHALDILTNNVARIAIAAAGAVTASSAWTYTGAGTSVTINNNARLNGIFAVGRAPDSTYLTVGVQIDQGAADNFALELDSSDVAHGITDNYRTSTFGAFGKANATGGGLRIHGLSDDTSAGLFGHGIQVTADTTKATTSNGAVRIAGSIKSGTATGAIGADGNIVVFANESTVRFILDGDGDSHQDVGTAWTNFDGYNDPEVLTALSVAVSKDTDPIKATFTNALERVPKQALTAMKLVTFNPDGHHFVNMSRLTMLHTGAIRQLADKQEAYIQAIISVLTPEQRMLLMTSAVGHLLEV